MWHERPSLVLTIRFRNTFGIPNVPSEPCLLPCPQVMFLGLLFTDQAFAAPILTDAKQLFRLRVPSGLNQQQIPIKDSMCVVRSLESTVHGLKVSPSAAATDNWLRGRLANLGDVTGLELPVGPYYFR